MTATTAGSSAGCAIATETNYDLGPVKPQLTQLVNILGPMFDIKTVGGYRESATDPHGHPAGLAADFMVPLTPAGKAQGDAVVAYAQAHAHELGIDYIIWYQRIWSVARADEGWRPMEDRGSATANHLDHLAHQRACPTPRLSPVGLEGASCDEVVYPVPAQYIGTRPAQLARRPAPTGPTGTPEPTSPSRAARPSTPPTPAPSRSTPARAGPARSWSRSPPAPPL